MNEREAIAFEMQDLKEQGRLDFEMYFELRKFRSKRYNELQERLREIDEVERNAKRVATTPKIEVKLPKPRETQPFTLPWSAKKELPEPRFKESVEDLRTDRVASKKGHPNAKVPIEEVVHEVEQYLQSVRKPVRLGSIRKHLELTFSTTWQNYNTLMKHVLEYSPYIQVDKTTKWFLYSYKEQKGE